MDTIYILQAGTKLKWRRRMEMYFFMKNLFLSGPTFSFKFLYTQDITFWTRPYLFFFAFFLFVCCAPF